MQERHVKYDISKSASNNCNKTQGYSINLEPWKQDMHVKYDNKLCFGIPHP